VPREDVDEGNAPSEDVDEVNVPREDVEEGNALSEDVDEGNVREGTGENVPMWMTGNCCEVGTVCFEIGRNEDEEAGAAVMSCTNTYTCT
jgi:hypothetical protein